MNKNRRSFQKFPILAFEPKKIKNLKKYFFGLITAGERGNLGF